MGTRRDREFLASITGEDKICKAGDERIECTCLAFPGESRMHANLRRALRACLFIAVTYGSSAVAQDGLPLHPLDSLTTTEYWTTYECFSRRAISMRTASLPASCCGSRR